MRTFKTAVGLMRFCDSCGGLSHDSPAKHHILTEFLTFKRGVVAILDSPLDQVRANVAEALHRILELTLRLLGKLEN